MLTLLRRSSLSPSLFYNLHSNPVILFLSFIAHSHTRTSTPNPKPNQINPLIHNYLIESFGFPKSRALSISNRFSRVKTLENPQSVVKFLKHLGFSDTHIQSSVRVTPHILFSDIDKTLKPKLQFFQQLGLTGSDLGKFISKNSTMLTRSLDRTLKPRIVILKKILTNDHNNEKLIRFLQRSNWVPESRFLSNISYIESCGIVGSQLSTLLSKRPRLFSMRESDIRDLVSRVLEMGFLIDSRMLVHALFTVNCLSTETLMRKFELLQSFGFSEVERMKMFRTTPALFRVSEEKLKLGIEFFMNTMKFERTILVGRPISLMLSMEERVIPRYRVLQLINSKKLLKKELSFLSVLRYSEEEFLEKFISKFSDDAEELLVAYKSHILDSAK